MAVLHQLVIVVFLYRRLQPQRDQNPDGDRADLAQELADGVDGLLACEYPSGAPSSAARRNIARPSRIACRALRSITDFTDITPGSGGLTPPFQTNRKVGVPILAVPSPSRQELTLVPVREADNQTESAQVRLPA